MGYKTMLVPGNSELLIVYRVQQRAMGVQPGAVVVHMRNSERSLLCCLYVDLLDEGHAWFIKLHVEF